MNKYVYLVIWRDNKYHHLVFDSKNEANIFIDSNKNISFSLSEVDAIKHWDSPIPVNTDYSGEL